MRNMLSNNKTFIKWYQAVSIYSTTMLIILSGSDDAVHTEFVPERKTVNAEFYKGVTDRLLKSNQLVRPAAFCSREFFFLLHDNAPAHKAASVCQFLRSPKLLQPFITHPLTPYFPDYFLFPKFENEVKKTPHCGFCWDPRSRNWWIEEGPNTGNFGSFSETARPPKSCRLSLFWI